MFTGNVCRIYTKNRDIVGEIKVKGGLYRVYMSGTKEGALAADATKVLSINDLHRQMGHVSHERARMLVKKGLVEGITLEDDSEVVVCESCEWAKGQRKEILRIREGKRHTTVGDEIHSDLWGPAPVESITSVIMSVLRTTIAGTPMSISSTRKMKPSRPTNLTKPGCLTSTRLGLNLFVLIEEENT